jgi:hypothetical protein
MSLNAGWAELQSALKDLRKHWEEVQAVWKDAARDDFEETCWEPLEDRVGGTLRAMDRLSLMLGQLKQDCS